LESIQGAFTNSQWMGTKIVYSEQNINQEENTSEVKVDFYLLSLNGGGGSYSEARNVIIRVDDQEQIISIGGWNVQKGEVAYLGSVVFTIPHLSDGSKSVSISSSYDTYYEPIGSSYLSTSFTLTKIRRASKLTCDNGNILDEVNLYLERYHNNFTHTITYSFKEKSGTIATGFNEDTLKWVIPESFYEEMPNEANANCQLQCTTYQNDTVIGISESIMQIGVDEEINRPSVEVSLIDSNTKTNQLTGNNQKLIKHFSNVTYLITATPKNYTTIKNYQIDCGLKSANGSEGVLENIENGSFTVTVTDNRDLVTVVEKTLTMVDYEKIAFDEVTMARVDRTSKEVYIKCSGTFYQGSFGEVENTLQLKYRYKESSGEWSNFIPLTPTIENGTFILNDVNLVEEFDENKQYEIELVALDELCDMSSEDTTIKVSKVILRGNPIYSEGEDKAVFTCNVYYENKDLLDLIYPINHPFLSYSGQNPREYLGFGEWELASKGRSLVGVDPDNAKYNQAGLQLGSETVSLTPEEMPSHVHLIRLHSIQVQPGSGSWVTQYSEDDSDIWTYETGESTPHDNLSPCETIYVWNRVA